jgi:hypothetical protein
VPFIPLGFSGHPRVLPLEVPAELVRPLDPPLRRYLLGLGLSEEQPQALNRG